MAIERNDAAIAKLLLSHGASASVVSLSRLVRQNDDPVGTKLALRCGVDAEATDPETGRSAVHLAAMYGYEESLAVLHEAGAKTDRVDAWGNTPADLARINSHSRIEALLKRESLKDQQKDGEGRS